MLARLGRAADAREAEGEEQLARQKGSKRLRKKEKGMQIKFLGHAAFLISATDGTRVITDPYKSGAFGNNIRYGEIREKADLVTVSHSHDDHGYVEGLPGKPEVVRASGMRKAKGIEFVGISTSHDERGGRERGQNTVFCFTVDSVRLCHLGDLGHQLDQRKAKEIGPMDVLFVPVGGLFTIDADGATAVCEALNPRVVIPMHFKTDRCGFALASVEEFLRGKQNVRRVGGSTVELRKEDLPTTRQIIVLEPAL